MNKKYYYMLRIVIGLTILFSFEGCDKDDPPVPPCTSTIEENVASVNGFDFRFGSPYYNQVITNFRFHQTITNYKDNCQPIEGSIHLTIQNVTNRTITFDYFIQYSLNAGGWQYQGVATIPPGGIHDAGEVSKRISRVNHGQARLTITSNNLVYR